MDAAGAERARPRPDVAARKRAAVETYARHEASLRRTAQRYSFCADDAEDALQRGLEILLRKAPTAEPRELVKWMQTVVKHEALAIRRDRERVLAGPAAAAPAPGAEDWVALLPSGSAGPEERLERREEIVRSREALQALKPQELRALTLLAEGYSYVEIGEITGWSRTKVNRCLAEGRERFRSLVARSEDGRRCQEMGPLLSAFCDAEATPAEAAALREHLRACASCRATLRAYRATPAAVAALAPAFPHSFWQRLQEALAEAPSRLGGGRGEALSGIAGSGGGLGLGGLAKVAVVCVCAVGGAAAGNATGLLPGPLDGGASPASQLEQPREDEPADPPQPGSPAGTDSNQATAGPDRKSKPQAPAETPSPTQASAEPEAVAAEPAPVEAETVEPGPSPAPAPVAEPAPAAAPSSGSASPAGEFGP